MENYKIFTPENRASFAARLEELETRLKAYIAEEAESGRSLAYAKIFLSDIRNQNDALEASPLYATLSSCRAVSVVGQAPLDGSKITVLAKTSDCRENFRLHSLRLTEQESEGKDSYQQTMLLFDKYTSYLNEHRLDMATHLVRTWIYISDIDTNYAGVVSARNDVFHKHGLTADTHYIASTGIGGDSHARHASVAIDFLTYPDIAESQKTYLKALDHLNPTHEYGVAFERATRLENHNLSHYYVSGTASIDRHGNVVHLGDVSKQTDRLIENTAALLADGGATMADIRYFIVYLRDVSDYPTVSSIFCQRFPNTPCAIVHARVCRPAWLIEAECIAEK